MPCMHLRMPLAACRLPLAARSLGRARRMSGAGPGQLGSAAHSIARTRNGAWRLQACARKTAFCDRQAAPEAPGTTAKSILEIAISPTRSARTCTEYFQPSEDADAAAVICCLAYATWYVRCVCVMVAGAADTSAVVAGADRRANTVAMVRSRPFKHAYARIWPTHPPTHPATHPPTHPPTHAQSERARGASEGGGGRTTTRLNTQIRAHTHADAHRSRSH